VPNPVIATKLRVARPRQDLVTRERLNARMEHGVAACLTLLSAPAGFGKTTLLGAWLAARKVRGRAVAWISLDRADNEPALFWLHLVAALEGAVAELGQALPPLLAPDQKPDRGTTAALLNALSEAEGELDVVLDDFHAIEDPSIIDELGYLLDHLPSSVHLVISTRADPPLPLARLRARGELTEVRGGPAVPRRGGGGLLRQHHAVEPHER
jgi:LuxR family maltose regulon positive regulatory protein